MSDASVMIVGIGNPDRGDDAVGRLVARRLRAMVGPGVAVVEHDGEAASLLDRLAGARTAFLIDACVSGAPPGTARRIDLGTDAGILPDLQFGLSTHGFGLAEAIALGRALGSLPPRAIVYAIEAGSFETGGGLTRAVADAVGTVAKQVAEEVMQDA
ncbi:MAG: hydrogenase maturation protease [Bauldia sp.]|uniref:hydrogenase maturation protease n=1 Tax=Bauldia sp. TaxID=2575872 RepID=UPI001E17DA83|nr:hydrogenase maturation protease [Bauldia sp.]MCB1496280.1 hydrogenase maturation protease [Bauldia sp.]